MKPTKILKTTILILILSSLSGCGFMQSKQEKVYSEAKVLLEEADYSAAIQKFDEAIALRNKDKVNNIDKEILKSRAEAEFKLEDYEAAKYSYDLLQQISDESDKVELKSLSLICLSRTDKSMMKAKLVFDELKNLNPSGKTYESALSEFAVSLSETKKRAYKQIDIDETNTQDELTDSDENIYKLFADIDEIKSVYENYYSSNKKAIISNSLGTLELISENYEKALEYYNVAASELSKEEKNEQSYALKKAVDFNKAVAYEYMGQYEEALNLFRQYIYNYGESESVLHEITFLKTRLSR